MDKLVSVVIPIYNGEKYLDRCISSIVDQSYQNFELILVNDGSTDQSETKCNCWLNKDDRIRYYRQNNTGVSSARNYGMDHATGEFVLFVDADDYLERTCIQKMLDVQKNTGVDIVACSATDFYDDGTIENGENGEADCLLQKTEAIFHFLKGKPLTAVCWGRLYKKSCVEFVRFDENMNIAEDGKFFLEAINNSKSVYFMAERLYFYFIREGSVVHSGFTEKYYDELNFCEELENRYKGQRMLEDAAQLKCYWFIVRLLKMPDLPKTDYYYLLLKLKQRYVDVKTQLSIKERVKFEVLSNSVLRRIYLKIKLRKLN